ncbi:sensor histidine kinase [Eubacterium sp. 1001713B170207_170306_E7]|uniref:sensor histidine kinase n=1 Tax=Eubacterium sp. 1001713B170207_170306_E7 TaxID=2787097 RepID=UPI0018996150|nr:sensor histidine kinase [Eubacterium sp. 1001713B170207_170306_E7]
MLIDIISTTLRVIACCIVFAYCLFTPFKSRFRYNNFITALLAVLLTIFTIVVVVLFLTSGKFFAAYSSFGIALWIVSAVVIFHIAIKGSFFEILFLVLMVLNLYVNIVAIAKVIANSVSLDLSYSVSYAFIVIGVLIVYIPLLWVLLVRLYRQVVEFEGDFSFWKYIWVIPALTYMIFFVKIVGDYWKAHALTDGADIMFTVLWSVTTYAFFLVTLLMLIQTYRGITAAQQTKLVSSQLRMQEDQYHRMIENVENNARLRHDWRHHLLSIDSFLDNKDMAGLQSYMRALAPEYAAESDIAFCQNPVVNAILLHYYTVARDKGIDMTAAANVPEGLNIPDTDLCIVFGNLVENAVEACAAREKEPRTVQIKADVKGRQLVLVIQNTYQRAVIFRDKQYYSTKHDGEGIGIASVKRIVEKNKGMMEIRYDENNFTVQVMLQAIPENNEVHKCR